MDICCVCYKNDINLLKINQIPANNDISIKTQLELLAPEVTWLKHYSICSKCQKDLNLIPKLRQQCLESQKVREMEIKVEEPTITDCPKFQLLIPSINSNQPPKKIIQNNLISEEVSGQSVITALDSKKICKVCGKMFRTKTELDVHEMLHVDKQKYVCVTCKKCFDSSLSLQFHNMTEHTDSMYWRYHCELCQKRFPMKQLYDEHIKSEHQNNFKQYKCDVCNKEYDIKKSMERHKGREHGGKKLKLDK